MKTYISLLTLSLILSGCNQTISVNSFEDCVQQTGEIMESYPRQCRDNNGKNWTEEINEKEAKNTKKDNINYHSEKPDLSGYIAVPEGDGPFPALILIHEWWGLNDNIREFADKFAAQGYVALAVDLYDGEVTETRERAMELVTAVRGDTDPAFENLRQAVAYLQSRDDVITESLASVGWCFGGGWAYQMAKNDLGVEASIMYYGQFEPEADFMNMRSSILGHFGETDRSIKVDDVEVFRANLQTASGEHAVYIYPNSGHGFANSDNPNYNSESAELAWKRTLEFLEEEL